MKWCVWCSDTNADVKMRLNCAVSPVNRSIDFGVAVIYAPLLARAGLQYITGKDRTKDRPFWDTKHHGSIYIGLYIYIYIYIYIHTYYIGFDFPAIRTYCQRHKIWFEPAAHCAADHTTPGRNDTEGSRSRSYPRQRMDCCNSLLRGILTDYCRSCNQFAIIFATRLIEAARRCDHITLMLHKLHHWRSVRHSIKFRVDFHGFSISVWSG